MKSMLPPDKDQDGIGMRKRRLAGDFEHRHRAEGHVGLHRGPIAVLDAYVLEINACQVQRDTAFFAAAAGEVEVDQSRHAHLVPRVGFVKLLGYIGLTARRWQNQNRDRQNAALIWTRAESLMSAPDPVAITLQQH